MKPTPPRVLLTALFTAFSALFVAACGEAEAPRDAAILSGLLASDEPLIRSRPELVHGKYARMAGNLYSFYRGNMGIYAADMRDGSLLISRTRFAAKGPFPIGSGDQHPENFGTLLAADGTFAVEPNDFDGADRYPYFWDLRRLTVGMVLMARLANPGDDARNAESRAVALDVARAVAASYAEAIAAHAAGAPRERLEDHRGVPAFVDMFRRSVRDHANRRELDELTTVVDGKRRLRRGPVDPEDLQNAFHELPEFMHAHVRSLVMEARETLISPPPPEFFEVLDAVRVVGKGVASWPRVRIFALVEGPTRELGDEEILEIKEVIDSGAEGFLPPGRYADSLVRRILEASRAMWSRPDAEPLFGAAEALGMTFHVRRESESHKTLRVHRAEDDRGRPEALLMLAEELGALLARIHATPAPGAEGAAASIARAIARDPEAFAEEEVAVALDYADRVEDDWRRFRALLARLGPRLGVPEDPRDLPRAELRALFGTGEPIPDMDLTE